MIRFYVPPLGARLVLSAPWTFTLHRERRNASLFPLVGWGTDNKYASDHASVRSADGNNPRWEGSESWAIERRSPITKRAFDFGEPVIPGSACGTYRVLKPGHRLEPVANPSRYGARWCCPLCSERASCPEDEYPIDVEVDGSIVRVVSSVPKEAVRLSVSARLKGGQSADVTLPAGTILIPDRYYIRQGANGFDSVTFRLAKPEGKRKKGDPVPLSGRFWCKLADANRIEFDLPPEVQPWWFGVADRLRAGETFDLAHDVPKVPNPIRVAPLTMRSVLDLPERERWLVYQEGARVVFWLVSDEPFTDVRRVPGEAFGMNDQLRGSDLPVHKVVGYVIAAEGL